MRVAVLLLLLLAPLTARGECLMGPAMFVVDVEIRSCTTRDAFIAATRECLPPWANGLQRRMLERNPGGVVIEGTTHRLMDVTRYDARSATLAGSVPVTEDGKWFVQADAKLDCATTNYGAPVRLALHKRCCDVIPPSGFDCWYGMDTLAPVPEPVRKAMEGR